MNIIIKLQAKFSILQLLQFATKMKNTIKIIAMWKMHFSKIRPRFMGNGNCLWAEHIMIKKHHYYRSASFSDRMQHTVFCSPTDIFRSKYGNIEKRNGSILLRKKLQGSGRKYFDSGDYNMQKEAIKPASRISTIPGKCHLWF